jgi:hypothetical protein
MSLVFVAACTAGFHYFERSVFPLSSGWVGIVVGFLLGAFLAALFEDYMDQEK